MKKTIIGILIGVAVLVLVALFFLMPKKAHMGPGVSLERFIPKSAVAYYSVKDVQSTWSKLRNSQFYKEISALPLWKEIQAQDAIGKFLVAFKEGFGFELTEQRIMDVVGEELTVAVLMGAPADPEPKVLFMTRTGTKTQLAELAGRLLDKAKSTSQQKIESWTYNGYQLNNVKSSDPTTPELNYGFLDNILVLGVGKSRSVLESVVDLYKGKDVGSIATSDNYKKFQGLVANVKGRDIGRFFMDFEQISKVIAQSNMQVPGAAANLGQTISMLKAIGGVTTINGSLFTKIYVIPNKEGMDATTKSLWEAKPGPLVSLQYVPEGTVLYSVTNSMDVKKLWGIWKDNLNKQAPEQAKTILDAITKAETTLGMSVENDLLSWVGDEIAYTFNDVNVEGVFPIPKMALLVKVTDKVKAQAFIEKIVDYVNRQAAVVTPAAPAVPAPAMPGEAAPAASAEMPAATLSPTPGETSSVTPAAVPAAPVAAPAPAPAPKLELQESSYNGVPIKFISIPLVGKGLAPGFAFLGDFLVLSTSAGTIEKMVDVSQGKSPSLLNDASYATVKGEIPEKTNQMGYINTQRIFDIAIEICNWVISFQNLNAAAPGSPAAVAPGQTDATQKILRDTVIPFLRAMKVVRVIGISTTYTPDGIEQIISLHLEDVAPVKK